MKRFRRVKRRLNKFIKLNGGIGGAIFYSLVYITLFPFAFIGYFVILWLAKKEERFQ